jgi:Do/DeqQ family serine protease
MKQKMKKGAIFSLAAAGALFGGLLVFGVSRAVESNNNPVETGFTERNDQVPTHFTAYEVGGYPDLTYAAENAVKAVVSIDKKGEVRRRPSYGGGGYNNPFFEFFGIPEGFGQPQQPDRQRQPESGKPEMRVLASGSGVLVSPDGYIVTNNHVAEDAGELNVTLQDGRTFTARMIGGDPTTDVALIKIDGENLPFLPFGDSDALRLGEWVLAIGTPYSLQSTVTAGIVSAKGRNLNVIENDMRLESFIQTDAAVNPGNSGGALVNAKGELVGINTLIQSPTGSYTGYSFAVPASIVKKVADDLRQYGVVQRALLGIEYQPIDNTFIEQMGKETGITEHGGIYVAGVAEGGAAEAAGIRKGDVLTEINGVAIPDAATLSEQIARYRPNDKVKISVKRDGQVKHFDITLRNRAGNTELLTQHSFDAAEALGGQFAEVSDKGKEALGITHGILVQGIGEGILQSVGVRRGFIITEINDVPIRSRSDLNKITEKIASIDGVYPEEKRFMRYWIARDSER